MTTQRIREGFREMKVKFVAKLGAMGKYDKDGEDKFHIMIPRQFIDEVRDLKGKQVKVTIEDEF
jgi:hypothetical protein